MGEDLFHAFLSAGRVEPPAEEAMRREARAFDLSDAGRGLDVAHTLYEAYRRGKYPEERICELMAWCFGGWKDGEMRAFARDVVERSGLAARFHPELHALLARAREEGIEVFLVSASPDRGSCAKRGRGPASTRRTWSPPRPSSTRGSSGPTSTVPSRTAPGRCSACAARIV